MQALVGEPLAGGGEQSLGRFEVVLAFEEAKHPARILETLDVTRVHDGGDPPHRLAIPSRQKGLDLGVVVERMPFVADHRGLVGP